MTPTVLLYLQKIGQLPVCEICKFDFQLKGIVEQSPVSWDHLRNPELDQACRGVHNLQLPQEIVVALSVFCSSTIALVKATVMSEPCAPATWAADLQSVLKLMKAACSMAQVKDLGDVSVENWKACETLAKSILEYKGSIHEMKQAGDDESEEATRALVVNVLSTRNALSQIVNDIDIELPGHLHDLLGYAKKDLDQTSHDIKERSKKALSGSLKMLGKAKAKLDKVAGGAGDAGALWKNGVQETASLEDMADQLEVLTKTSFCDGIRRRAENVKEVRTEHILTTIRKCIPMSSSLYIF